MIGRVPTFMPMEMAPQYQVPQTYAAPAQPYAAPAAAPRAAWAQPHASHPPQTPNANLPSPRTWRGQDADDPRLQLPSPEQLGLHHSAPTAAKTVDWTAVHQRLDRLGATCFHMEKLERGSRVTCVLPTSKADY